VTELVPAIRQRAAPCDQIVVDAFPELYEERALTECPDAR
jgi:hypothetical protein